MQVSGTEKFSLTPIYTVSFRQFSDIDMLEAEFEEVPATKIIETYQVYNFYFGDFDVKWKILETSTLQESGSETFSFNSV